MEKRNRKERKRLALFAHQVLGEGSLSTPYFVPFPSSLAGFDPFAPPPGRAGEQHGEAGPHRGHGGLGQSPRLGRGDRGRGLPPVRRCFPNGGAGGARRTWEGPNRLASTGDGVGKTRPGAWEFWHLRQSSTTEEDGEELVGRRSSGLASRITVERRRGDVAVGGANGSGRGFRQASLFLPSPTGARGPRPRGSKNIRTNLDNT